MTEQNQEHKIVGWVPVFKSEATNPTITSEEVEQTLDKVFPRPLDIKLET